MTNYKNVILYQTDGSCLSWHSHYIMQDMRPRYIISPSILSADLGDLANDVKAVTEAGAHEIHFDVMDHHFVPNLTFGAPVCASLRKKGITVPISVHLMVTNPDDFIDEFSKTGADTIIFHPETSENPANTIEKILAAGMQPGLVFNPDKPVEVSTKLLEKLHIILIMTVFPGFGGQEFIEDTLSKITGTRDLINKANLPIRVGVDGGIKVDNIAKVAKAGADFFVVGSGMFSADNYQNRIEEILKEL